MERDKSRIGGPCNTCCQCLSFCITSLLLNSVLFVFVLDLVLVPSLARVYAYDAVVFRSVLCHTAILHSHSFVIVTVGLDRAQMTVEFADPFIAVVLVSLFVPVPVHVHERTEPS